MHTGMCTFAAKVVVSSTWGHAIPPTSQAREAILGIHTRAWAERPPQPLLAHLAGMTAGYCGADLKVLF